MRTAGLVFLLLALGACERECYLEGCFIKPPVTLQVFVSNTPADDTQSGLTMIYGQHMDVLGGAPATGVRATAVPRSGAEFRVVVSALLEGRTVEEFACAGLGYTREPSDCHDCRDNPATAANEAGSCLDLNGDRIPDVSRIVGGVATIRCPGRGTYTTLPGDGWYYWSGNQLPTAAFGLAGLGPAIVIAPRAILPADADCTLDLNDGITGKSGDPLIWPEGGVPFHTAVE